MNDSQDEVKALHLELERLTQRQTEIQRAIEARSQENARLERVLEDLRGGLRRRRLWPYLLLAVVVAAAIGGGLWWYRGSDAPMQLRVVRQRLDPHLLVTSVPDGAEVFVAGRPVGRSPLLHRLPPERGSVRVELRLAGHRPFSGSARTSESGGAHVHAILPPLP